MSKLSIMKATLTKVVGRSGLVLKKFSPEILIGVGIIGVVAGTVLACKATLKVDTVIDKAQSDLKKIKETHENPKTENYSEADYQKDLVTVYVQTGVKIAKLYAPAVMLGVASVSCLLGAHGIMKQRNIALVAAYRAIDGGFKDYRRRVVDELGQDKDYQFKTGIRQETVTEIEKDEHGKSIKVKKTVEKLDPNEYSTYARFFDEASLNWSKTPEYNKYFLKCQQNYANDLLKSRGHIFLNEVYDMIGVPRSQAGAVVGWVLGKDNDNFVDFGMYNLDRMPARDFINGYERSILLDFNVDGVILDLI
jgi:hypothetical protein